MKILLSLFLATIAAVSYAQVTEEWVSPGSYYGLDGKMVAVDEADNVFTLSDIFHGDIYLTKRDKYGNILWDTTYNNITPSQWEEASWLCIDGSGNAIVTGYTNTGFGSEWYPVQMVTMKFNGVTGALEWRVTESSGGAYRGRVCEVDADNNIYVGGEKNAFRTSYYDTGNQVVIKYSPEGTKIWETSLDESGNIIPGPLSALKFDPTGNIIITGTTPFANTQTSAKISTEGDCIWHTTFDNLGGADIAINGDGEIFIVGSWYVAGTLDITIRKVNTSGSLLWENSYNFGSAELSRKIICDSNGNAVVIGYGSQLSGMPYVDWIIFKIDGSGTQQWESRYNEHANNDEWPWGITIDEWDNVYVIGQGGPWPGYFWTSLTQMVTIKYTPSGVEEWVALHTDYTNTGSAICLASDNSIYAVGQQYAVTIHYNQVLTPVCDTPDGLFSNNITSSAARLNWTVIPGAYQYEVWYKKTTAATWKKKFVLGTKNKLNIKNLQPSKEYVWKIRTICDTTGTDLLSDFSTDQFFTTLPLREGQTDVLTAYPNPASEVINIQWNVEGDNVSLIQLINLNGQVVWSNVFEAGYNNTAIDVENMPAGIYLITINNGVETNTLQIVIE